MVASTLTSIENWYQDVAGDTAKSTLLSKLAIMEFCGWLEEWMDQLIRDIDEACLKDSKWIQKSVIDNTHGFHYEKHLRGMLCSVLGEVRMRQIEKDYESKHPGDLEAVQAALGHLWVTRCKLAHSDLAAHKAAQVSLNAPSWTKNQFKVLSKRLDRLKSCVMDSL